jgi:hypothetical protein
MSPATFDLKSLDEEIDRRKKRLDNILKGGLKPRLRNFRYVVDFEFNPSGLGGGPELPGVLLGGAAPFTQVQKSLVVKKGTMFDVVAVETAYTAVGTLASTGEAAQLTLSYWQRRTMFDYYFGVYDSGSDRAWQNQLLPSWVLASENRNGFWFSGPDTGGRGLLSSGSELVVTVAPFVCTQGQPTTTGLTTLSSHNLQISFVGVEVML